MHRHCIAKGFVGHEIQLCTMSILRLQRCHVIGMKSVPAGNQFVHGLT